MLLCSDSDASLSSTVLLKMTHEDLRSYVAVSRSRFRMRFQMVTILAVIDETASAVGPLRAHPET